MDSVAHSTNSPLIRMSLENSLSSCFCITVVEASEINLLNMLSLMFICWRHLFILVASRTLVKLRILLKLMSSAYSLGHAARSMYELRD